jgi:CheY-like chemotaxis protein
VPTKILVADDSVTMRRVLEMTFAGEDARVVAVESAEAALLKAAEFAPDVVFADISLPGVDGYELCRKLKTQGGSKAAVIAVASQHHPFDEAKGRAAGLDDHVSKPFDTQALIDRVSQVLARQRNVPTGAAAPAALPEAPKAPVLQVARVPAPPIPAAARPQAPAAAAIPAPPVTLAPAPPKPVAVPQAPLPAAANANAVPSEVARPTAPVAARGLDSLQIKLSGLGLNAEQLAGVLALSREVIEQVVWEVVPDLAETIIKEELRRLTAD